MTRDEKQQRNRKKTKHSRAADIKREALHCSIRHLAPLLRPRITLFRAFCSWEAVGRFGTGGV